MKTPKEYAEEILNDKNPYAFQIAEKLEQAEEGDRVDRVLNYQAACCLREACAYKKQIADSIVEDGKQMTIRITDNRQEWLIHLGEEYAQAKRNEEEAEKVYRAAKGRRIRIEEDIASIGGYILDDRAWSAKSFPPKSGVDSNNARGVIAESEKRMEDENG